MPDSKVKQNKNTHKKTRHERPFTTLLEFNFSNVFKSDVYVSYLTSILENQFKNSFIPCRQSIILRLFVFLSSKKAFLPRQLMEN